MALIKCPNCNHDISDTVGKCIHCGQQVIKSQKKDGSSKLQEDSINVEFLNKKNHISYSESAKLLNKIDKHNIINLFFTCGFLVLIYCFKTIITKHSGTVTLISFAKWLFRNYVDYTVANLLNMIIVIYLIICLLSSYSKFYNRISKIGYCLILVIEIIFFVFLYLIGYRLNTYGFIVLVYTIIWLVVEFYLLKQKRKKENKNSNTTQPEKISKYTINDLQKLQELLKNKAITEKEYEKLKQSVIENIIEK